MANSFASGLPRDLNHSELGTKEYWDQYYQNDLDAETDLDELTNPSELESWFDDVDAPTKVLDYLTSQDFPLSFDNPSRTVESPSVLDVGTGNGSALMQLRIDGKYDGRMIGIDYSRQSVELARKLWKGYTDNQEDEHALRFEDISFQVGDLISDDLTKEPWWPEGGFDLVHDKGTFDAISLSSELIQNNDGEERRVFELYPAKVIRLIKHGGYLIITSCNWTENELRRWFLDNEEVKGQLQEFGKVKYPVFEFGGRKGQAVASLCFRRVAR